MSFYCAQGILVGCDRTSAGGSDSGTRRVVRAMVSAYDANSFDFGTAETLGICPGDLGGAPSPGCCAPRAWGHTPRPVVPESAIEVLRGSGADLAVLFGSRATGRAHPGSDWDIAVKGPAELDLDRLTAELERAVGGRVDLVDLRRADPLLAMQCVRESKVLFDTTGSEFAAFASLALRRFEDTRKLRALASESIAAFLSQRGLR